MPKPAFESVLDECIDDLRSGRRSLDECLARWPEHASSLAPLLRTAVAAHQLSIAEQPSTAAARADFMRAIRNTTQQRPQGILGALMDALRMATRPRLMLIPGAMTVAFALLLVFGSSAPPRAEASSTLTVFSGAVEVERDGRWTPLADGAGLPTGARIRTSGEGRALLTFADGSTVALDPASELVVEVVLTDGPRQIVLRQESGRLLHQVVPDERPGAAFEVRTASATVSARGTVFETTIEAGETEVSTSDGLVEVVAGAERVNVASGESASAAPQRPLRAVPQTARAAATAMLLVDAPFAASVIGPDGRATGALPSGIVYQQIPGAFSSNPVVGAQRIELSKVRPGEYTLLLRRTAAGEGQMRLSVADAEESVEIGEDGDVLALRLVITSSGGSVSVKPVEIPAVARTVPVQQERVVVTERARQRAEELRQSITPAPQRRQASATPVPTTTASTATAAPKESATPRATSTPVAVPARTTPSVTVTPTRQATASPTRTVEPRPIRTPIAVPTRPEITVIPVRPRPVITATPRPQPTSTATPSSGRSFRDLEEMFERVLPGRSR